MPPSRRAQAATADLTTSPPDILPANQTLARVTKAAGNNLFYVEFPPSSTVPTPPVAATSGASDGADVVITSTIDSDQQVQSHTTPEAKPAVLVELHPRFRSTIYLKRGSYVLVDRVALAERSNKLGGEIVNVVREEKVWRKMRWWPTEWRKESAGRDMMPSDDDEEEGEGADEGHEQP